MLREDPRYYQMGKDALFIALPRDQPALCPFERIQDTSDSTTPKSFGNAAAATISNIYHVPADRTAFANCDELLLFLILIRRDNTN